MDRTASFANPYGIQLDRVLRIAFILSAAGAVVVYFERFLRRLLSTHRRSIRFSQEINWLVVRISECALWVCGCMPLLIFSGFSVTKGVWAPLYSVSVVVGVGFLAILTRFCHITARFYIAIARPFPRIPKAEIFCQHLRRDAAAPVMMFPARRENENGNTRSMSIKLFFQKTFRVAESHLYLFDNFRADNHLNHPGASIADHATSLPR